MNEELSRKMLDDKNLTVAQQLIQIVKAQMLLDESQPPSAAKRLGKARDPAALYPKYSDVIDAIMEYKDADKFVFD